MAETGRIGDAGSGEPDSTYSLWRAIRRFFDKGDNEQSLRAQLEEVIDEHYQKQSAALGADDPELKTMIDTFRVEEIEHRDIGLAEGAARAPAYELLKGAIKTGSRMAIWLAERI